MRVLASVLLLLLADVPHQPEPAIPYFTNVREVQVVQPDHQTFFIVDEELWNHSRPDLGDLRLYDEQSPVQYALSEQRAAVSSEEVEARILNLGSVSGHTEFDLDAGPIAQYDRIRLRLDAHDFVATASVSGGAAAGKKEVEFPPSTVYDFTKEQLGSNSLLKIPASSFRYLHVRLSAGIKPQQVTGAAIYNLSEQQAIWTKVGSCAPARQNQRMTVIACEAPAKAPLSRIAFEIAPAQVNFRRSVTIEDAAGAQIASGEFSRVRINRGGTLVTDEQLYVSVPGNAGKFTVNIDNGENPPLQITAADAVTLERRIYFEPQGKSKLTLYYGDEQLSPPIYDYARFFRAENSPGRAQLGPGEHNAQFRGRPDSRPWSERHTGVLWTAMLLAVVALAGLAFRGLRTGTTR